MAKIKVIVYDENNNEIKTHEYSMSANLLQLNDMERQIEDLMPTILLDITHGLLSNAQEQEVKKNR